MCIGIFVVSDTNDKISHLGVWFRVYPWEDVIAQSGCLQVAIPLINSCMDNRTYLKTIYESVISLGIVQSQYAFGRLCGRRNSWFSTAKSRNRPMSIAAMINLAMTLDRLSSDPMSPAQHGIRELARTVWLLIESREISDPKQRHILLGSRGRSISQEC